MSAGQIGYVIGGFFFALLLPVLILIVCRFIPVAQRRPEIIYGICGLLAVATPFLAAVVSRDIVSSALSATLAGGLIFWGYKRTVKKNAVAHT